MSDLNNDHRAANWTISEEVRQMAPQVTREGRSVASRLFTFPRRNHPSIFDGDVFTPAVLNACSSSAEPSSVVVGLLTARSCANSPRRTISRPRRRDRGSCRARARTRPPSCNRGVRKRQKKASSNAQRASCGDGE